MEIYVDDNGNRVYYNTPYVEMSEIGNTFPWSPYHNFNYGLYDKAQPSCGLWRDLVRDYDCSTCCGCARTRHGCCPPFTTVRGRSSCRNRRGCC